MLNEPVPAPKCQVIEMSTGKTRSLIEGKSKSGKSTIIIFWTKWYLKALLKIDDIIVSLNSYFIQGVCHLSELLITWLSMPSAIIHK